MSHEFYGATARAVAEINRLLKLPATGREQDWEFELADPKRIHEMLNLLVLGNLNDECRSALALLLLASMEEQDSLEPRDLVQAKEWFLRNKRARDQMHFYWIQMSRATRPDLISRVLGIG
ncbi:MULTISPECIES: hypothetical protein [unclassified Variovorax]|uniref:hypothetical protein n=1 Tax=unclassified Variovorax TaxID=663243 RepID=UPI0011135031|nr:hypothetical protein [Variovorax sp. CF079]